MMKVKRIYRLNKQNLGEDCSSLDGDTDEEFLPCRLSWMKSQWE